MSAIINSFVEPNVKIKDLPRFFRLYKAGFVTQCACGKEVPFELFVMAESLERAQELVLNHPRFQNDVDAYLRYVAEIKLEDYFNKVLN